EAPGARELLPQRVPGQLPQELYAGAMLSFDDAAERTVAGDATHPGSVGQRIDRIHKDVDPFAGHQGSAEESDGSSRIGPPGDVVERGVNSVFDATQTVARNELGQLLDPPVRFGGDYIGLAQPGRFMAR